MQYEMVVFGEDWGSHPSSTQHIIKCLIERHNVIWVNSIGLRAPRPNVKDVKRVWRKLISMALKPRKKLKDHSLTVVSPQALPFYGNTLARYLNGFLLKNIVSKAMKQKEMVTPVIWTSLPSAVDVIGKLNEVKVVYYCGDDFGSLAGVDHLAISKMEDELVDKADIILVASGELKRKFPADKTYLLPHGVDISAFVKPSARPEDLPMGKPIAGFYGNLAEWIDINLLADFAASLTDWNLVLIGPHNTDLSRLKKLGNVFLLGEKEHSELGAYVQHWDVSLLPFKNNAQIKACNPLKLREYFAAGKPVVSVDFPALAEFKDLVYVADTSQDFKNLVVKAKSEPEMLRVCRRKRIEKSSWDNRAKYVEKLLNNNL